MYRTLKTTDKPPGNSYCLALVSSLPFLLLGRLKRKGYLHCSKVNRMAPVKKISLQGTPILTSDNSWSKERRMGLNQLKIWTSLPALPTPLLDGVTHQGKPTVSRFVLLIFCSRCTIAPHDIGVSFTGIHCQGHIPETKGGGVSWQLLLLSPPLQCLRSHWERMVLVNLEAMFAKTKQDNNKFGPHDQVLRSYQVTFYFHRGQSSRTLVTRLSWQETLLRLSQQLMYVVR